MTRSDSRRTPHRVRQGSRRQRDPSKPPIQPPVRKVEYEVSVAFAPPLHDVKALPKRYVKEECSKNKAYLHSRRLRTMLMRSESWNCSTPTKVRNRGIPYIDKYGHIGGSCLMNWRCSSSQWFATVCHNVLKKIKSRMRSGHFDKKRVKGNDFLARVATFYVITQDDWAFERLICCHKSGARKLLHHLVMNMGDLQRFLYGQMVNSISWLQLRGKPRVKPIKITEVAEYRDFRGSYDTQRLRNAYLNFLCDPWIVGELRYTQDLKRDLYSCKLPNDVYTKSISQFTRLLLNADRIRA